MLKRCDNPTQMRRYIQAFWFRHSTPYIEGDYDYPLRLFASKWGAIRREEDA